MNRFLCFVVGLTTLVSVPQGQVAPRTARANGKAVTQAEARLRPP
jgi:hypothetical protein